MDHNHDLRNDAGKQLKTEEEPFAAGNAAAAERMQLAMERISRIPEDTGVPEPFRDFFLTAGAFLERIFSLRRALADGSFCRESLAEMRRRQAGLYRDMLPEHYAASWLNPAAAVKKAGPGCGRLLSALYAELFSLLRFVFEGREDDALPVLEIFLEICAMFSAGEIPKEQEIQDALYWYASDYLDITVPQRVRECLTPSPDPAFSLYHGMDPRDLRYLFFSGDYISEETLETARYLNALPEDAAEKAAAALVTGYEEGFRVMGRDLKRNKTCEIRFVRGFERLVLRASELFEERDGLRVILPGTAARLSERIPGRSARQNSLSPNRQFDFDHRFDAAIFWDKAFTDRKLAELTAAYESMKEEASLFAGPAVMEYFGEAPFEPLLCEEAYAFRPRQQKLLNSFLTSLTNLRDRFIPGEETSFSIISWPIPAIGSSYDQIFDSILRINTLENEKWRAVQQKIIDVLDRCDHAEVRGEADNETRLRISLWPLSHPERETRFENCVSDVNIPAGEVFTSPVLRGTEGLLHVKRVFVDGILFRDLKIRFENGRTVSATCGNFDSEEKNRRFVLENLCGSHEVLPMGEFAIGTNTCAFAAAERFGIWDRLPILIAEKTGPHFALGDTCYSHEEETMTYNPDGKAIVARENEISERRHENPEEAYFGFHMDITLPYGEIGAVTAVMPDGSGIDIIRHGRFVLEGTQELNRPLDSGTGDA